MSRNERLLWLYDAQNGKCAYCRTDMTLKLGFSNTATKDHVIPKSVIRGGKISADYNLVAACQECNEVKADMPLPIFLAHLFKCDNV